MERKYLKYWVARIAPILGVARGVDYVESLELDRAEIILDVITSPTDGSRRETIGFRFGQDGPIYTITIEGHLMEIEAEDGQQRTRIFRYDGVELRSYLQPLPGREQLN